MQITTNEEFQISESNAMSFSSANDVLFWRSNLQQRGAGHASPLGWQNPPNIQNSFMTTHKEGQPAKWPEAPALLHQHFCAWERPPRPLMPPPLLAQDLGICGEPLLCPALLWGVNSSSLWRANLWRGILAQLAKQPQVGANYFLL